MTYGRYRFMHPVVQQIEVNVNKPTRELDSIRVAVIGDLHLGYMINRKTHEAIRGLDYGSTT